jgi:CDP-diacylglycerol---glycerol-3-phosphate 3-phosphatidyltransferase
MTSMGIYRIKPWFQRRLEPLVNWMVEKRVSPDWLTWGAVVVGGVMGAALILSVQQPLLLWLVALGALGRLALNAMDGQVSRRLGYAGNWGEVKNELGDRLADMLIFGAAIFMPSIPLILSVFTLAVAFITSYVGILGKAVTGQREYGGVMGKPDRMAAVGFGAGIVALTGRWEVFSIAFAIIIILGIVTIGMRLKAIYERC